jgi:hypothetical protein
VATLRIARSVRLSSAVEGGSGISVGLALRILHRAWRRLVVQLRANRLPTRGSACWTGAFDLALKLRNLRRARPGLGGDTGADERDGHQHYETRHDQPPFEALIPVLLACTYLPVP